MEKVLVAGAFSEYYHLLSTIDVKIEELYWTPETINYEQPRNILINVIIKS